MRYHWGLGVGHTYSRRQATATDTGGSENPLETGIAENEMDDDDGMSEATNPVDNVTEGAEAEDQDGDFEGSDSDSQTNLDPSTAAAAAKFSASDDLDSEDEEIYGMYEDSDV